MHDSIKENAHMFVRFSWSHNSDDYMRRCLAGTRVLSLLGWTKVGTVYAGFYWFFLEKNTALARKKGDPASQKQAAK